MSRGPVATAGAVALLVLGPLASTGAATAARSDADAILGTWRTEDQDGHRDSIVEIRRVGDEYVGTIVWVRYRVYPDWDPKGWAGRPVVDRENPDPALRRRPLQGLRVLEGMRYDGGQWVGGSLYSPRRGTTYRARARLEGPDTLSIRGYVGTPWLGRDVTWLRAEVPAAGGTHTPGAGDAPPHGSRTRPRAAP